MIRRRRPSEPPTEVNLGVIITPMLDTCFQLLFFFIVMYRPHVLEGQMMMSLPIKDQEAKGPEVLKPNLAPDQPPKDLAELTLVIRGRLGGEHEGDISQIIVREGVTEKQIDIPYLKDGETVDLPTLSQRLKAHLKEVRARLNNKEDFQVQAEHRVKWDRVMRVVDICLLEEVGFTKPGFQKPPDAPEKKKP
jgi:biopolymer transport protein ExbD